MPTIALLSKRPKQVLDPFARYSLASCSKRYPDLSVLHFLSFEKDLKTSTPLSRSMRTFYSTAGATDLGDEDFPLPASQQAEPRWLMQGDTDF